MDLDETYSRNAMMDALRLSYSSNMISYEIITLSSTEKHKAI